jgi:transcriptional regulator of acetoin/glycerol metabolism
LPPLRERQDIADLIEAVVRRRVAALGLAQPAAGSESFITPAAMQCMRAYRWPGNIRELEHVVHALVALVGAERPIDVADLPGEIAACGSVDSPRGGAADDPTPRLQAAQVSAIRLALKEQGGNIAATARALGISRSALYNKLKRFGLD